MTNLSIIPMTTEKAYGLVVSQNTYIFRVPVDANRRQITASVESQFNVKVKNIRTLVQDGKAIRFNRGKNRNPGSTFRADYKKAYVTLVEGDSLKIFEKPDEAKEEKK